MDLLPFPVNQLPCSTKRTGFEGNELSVEHFLAVCAQLFDLWIASPLLSSHFHESSYRHRLAIREPQYPIHGEGGDSVSVTRDGKDATVKQSKHRPVTGEHHLIELPLTRRCHESACKSIATETCFRKVISNVFTHQSMRNEKHSCCIFDDRRELPVKFAARHGHR